MKINQIIQFIDFTPRLFYLACELINDDVELFGPFIFSTPNAPPGPPEILLIQLNSTENSMKIQFRSSNYSNGLLGLARDPIEELYCSNEFSFI